MVPSRSRSHLRLWAACLFAAIALPAAAQNAPVGEGKAAGILVVYFGSVDCRWCTWWEGPTGMEKAFKASPEFRRITYREVKNERLADPYLAKHFEPDLQWLWPRLYGIGDEARKERVRARPQWSIYVDGTFVASYIGTEEWKDKAAPHIRKLVEERGR